MALCDALPCDIISVDSALVYRGLDIGSAKPTPGRAGAAIPMRWWIFATPRKPILRRCSAAMPCGKCSAVATPGGFPFWWGGTMLYFKALLEGLAEMPEADPAIREAIAEKAKREGWSAIHAELAAVDPACAEQIHPNHSQRLSRALEVYRASGVTMSEWRERQTEQRPPWQFFSVCGGAAGSRRTASPN